MVSFKVAGGSTSGFFEGVGGSTKTILYMYFQMGMFIT